MDGNCNIKELGYQCCYCNLTIESTDVDPCDINILINIDKPKDKQENQTFYCHAKCFEKTLHEKIKGYFVIHYVED
jgi:hypothetical protein